MKQETGVLLVNLGTPDDPSPAAVGRYLNEFLMDSYVIRIPYILRWILVRILIVPRRKYASSHAYQSIWDAKKGSPLAYHTRALWEAIAEVFAGRPVVYAMRYGQPSIRVGIQKLKDQGVKRIILVPLYPQYALSSTETCIQKFEKELKNIAPQISYGVLNAFYEDPRYLEALKKQVESCLKHKDYDQVVFSFHGLPVSHVKATDPSSNHCYLNKACCESFRVHSPLCYRAQSFATAQGVAKLLGLSPGQYRVSFQSRLGREPWLEPYTDEVFKKLGSEGCKKVLVVCPSFTADCLETLEEISVRGLEEFRQGGGEELDLVPALNAEPHWVKALGEMIHQLIDPWQKSPIKASDP